MSKILNVGIDVSLQKAVVSLLTQDGERGKVVHSASLPEVSRMGAEPTYQVLGKE